MKMMRLHISMNGIAYSLPILIAGVFFAVYVVPSHAGQINSSLIPNDTDFIFQPYLDRVKIPTAWEVLENNLLQRDVVIAVLDTGVDIFHSDLVNIIWRNEDEIPGDNIDNDGNTYIDDFYGWDFVNSVPDPSPKTGEEYDKEAIHHGTVVSGIAAAEINNTRGIAGASYRARIMPLRILDGKGVGNTLVLAQAINYAVDNGADIINLSLVGDTVDPILTKALDRAYLHGVAVVAAAGNQEAQGVNLDIAPRYPVCDTSAVNKILGVAALDGRNRLSSFSNFGSSCIDIAAPGTDFYSTSIFVENSTEFTEPYSGGWNGTSVAAPLVSATLAMIKQVAPNLTLEQMYDSILESAQALQTYDSLNYADLGAGLLNAEKALRVAIQKSRKKIVAIVSAAGPGQQSRITISDKSGMIIGEFDAYGSSFLGGVTVAVGDIDADGIDDIITVPASGGGPHVRIFDSQGNVKNQFMAYNPAYRGGLSLAIADVDGDDVPEIITAPLQGGGPHVRIFDNQGNLRNQFMAYDPSFRGGVHLATGDLDRDGRSEIITVPASGGGPHVRIFDEKGNVKGQFMAFDPAFRGGLSIDIGDIDNDQWSEIVIMPIVDTNATIKIFNAVAQEENRFFAFSNPDDRAQRSNLLVADFTGDGRDNIVLTTEVGSTLRALDQFGIEFGRLKIFADEDTSGKRFDFALMRL